MIKPGNYRSLAVVLLTLCVEAARADTVRDIEWQDLIPRGEGSVVAGIDKSPDPVITHESSLASLLVEQTKAGRGLSIIPELDGQPVRIPGYLVPLDFDKTAVAEFPAGALLWCVHTRPSPASQSDRLCRDKLPLSGSPAVRGSLGERYPSNRVVLQ